MSEAYEDQRSKLAAIEWLASFTTWIIFMEDERMVRATAAYKGLLISASGEFVSDAAIALKTKIEGM